MASWNWAWVLRFSHSILIAFRWQILGQWVSAKSKTCMHACMHACCKTCNIVEVLLACRWHLFPGHNIEERLQGAFDSFHSWCVAEGKKTSLRKFELKTFKMSSCLGLSIMQHVHTYHACTGPSTKTIVCFMPVCLCMHLAEGFRLQSKVAVMARRVWKSSWYYSACWMAASSYRGSFAWGPRILAEWCACNRWCEWFSIGYE